MPSFDPFTLARAFDGVARGVAQGAYPGAVAAVGGVDGVEAVRAFGLAVQEPERLPMRIDTVFDLASLTKVVATTPALLGRYTVELATRSYTPTMADNRALGWQKPPAAAFPKVRAACGDMFSASAFGHTGFTGTSLWIDPEKDLFVILMTNRLHPTASDGLFAVRPAFHNAVVAALR